MKILITSLFDPTKSYGGGIESYVLELSMRLSKHYKVEIDVICSSKFSFSRKTRFGHIIGIKVPKSDYFGKANLLIKKFYFNRGLRKYILTNGDSYDIIQVNGDMGGFKELKDYNTISVFHGWAATNYKNANKLYKLLIYLFSVRYEMKNLLYAKKTVFVAEHIKKSSDKKDGIVIYNGIDTKKFKPIKETKIQKLNSYTKQDTTKTNILFIGKDPKRKGLDIAIKAVEFANTKVKNKIYLNIIGSNGYIKSKYAIYLGNVYNNLKIKYLQASKIFIFPSRYEGFSIATMEALSCGLPIIISDKTGVNEIVKNNLNGIIIKNSDFKSYSKSIIELIKDKNKSKHISTNGRKLALKYDWDNVAFKYYNLYKSLTKRNH